MDNKLYELTPSQEVICLQTKYTLFKRVVNILFSATTDKELDFNIMRKAFNLLVERNDSLRIRFIKKDKKLMQYFLDEYKYENIEVIKFNSKEEQESWINKKRKKAIKYLNGVVCEPYFIKTYDNKSMVFLKVCHLILDIYGLNIIFKDLFAIYNSLIKNETLPECPTKYEEVVINDLKSKHNEKRYQENYEFFKNLLENKPEPYYVGINGLNEPIIQKRHKKNKRAMQMFFINNDTVGYEYVIPSSLMEKANIYCEKNNVSLTNLLFYGCSLTASLLNEKKENVLHLQLCNRRSSMLEKHTAGCKVQSIGCYTEFDFTKSFLENINTFAINQLALYRRVGFPDVDFETLLHKIYPSNMLETYYSITFSFIPYEKDEDIRYDIYSNEKGALPCYLALLYDINTKEVRMCYDCQSKIIKEKDVINFHKKYVDVLTQIIENEEITLTEIKL